MGREQPLYGAPPQRCYSHPALCRRASQVARITRSALRLSAIASVLNTPCFHMPLRSPFGAPEPLAPPCIRSGGKRWRWNYAYAGKQKSMALAITVVEEAT